MPHSCFVHRTGLSQSPQLLINFAPGEPAGRFAHLGVTSFGLSDGHGACRDHLFNEPERAMDLDAFCLTRGPEPSITGQQRTLFLPSECQREQVIDAGTEASVL